MNRRELRWLVGIVAGAVVGALIVGTGGGALVVAAAIAGGVAAGGGAGSVLGSLSSLGGVVTGTIQSGDGALWACRTQSKGSAPSIRDSSLLSP